jgi:zinc protease
MTARRAALFLLLPLLLSRHAGGEEISFAAPEAFRAVLPNGLTVVVREDHDLPIAAVQLWVRAGSVFESSRLGGGLSHLVEHLAFKGTAGAEQEEIPRQIQSLGGEINAFTSLDHTVFDLKVPSARLRPALGLLRRLVFTVAFEPEEIAREKEVVLKEMNMNRDDPDRRISELFWATAFQVHPYRFPVIGYPQILQGLSADDVIDYYRTWYVPNNMVLAVAGDISAADALALAEEIFREDQRKPYPHAALPVEPRQLVSRQAAETMEIASARLQIGFHTGSLYHPDLYPLDVLAILLGQGRSSILYQEIREKRKLVHSIGASSYTPSFPGVFVISAELDSANLDPAREAIGETLRRVRAGELITAEGLEKARRQVLADYVRSLETVEGQAHDLGSSLLLTGSTDFSRKYVEGISAVTLADLARVAARYLRDENMTTAIVRPAPAASPAPPPPSQAQGEMVRHILPNGLTVLIRPDRRLPLVSARIFFQGGVLAENEENNGTANFLSRMLLKGTRERSARRIAEEIEGEGGNIGTYSGHNSFGASVDVLSDQLETGLKVLSDICLHPAFPPEEMEKERAVILAEIAAEKDRPETIAGRLTREAIFGAHPYHFRIGGTEESVRRIDRAALEEYSRAYGCGRNGVLAVFGDVDPERALDLAGRAFADLPEGKAAELAGRHPLPSSPAANITEVKPGAEQAVLMVGFPGVDVKSPDRYPLEVLSSIFTGLGSELFVRVRDEMGLAYYLGAYEILGLDPGAYVFYAGTVPGKTDTVLREIRSEIKRVQDVGVTEEELRRNQDRLIGRREFGLQSNDGLAFTVALDELYGLGYDRYREYEEKIRAVTAEDLGRVAREYLGEDRCAVVVVQPEEGKDSKALK